MRLTYYFVLILFFMSLALRNYSQFAIVKNKDLKKIVSSTLHIVDRDYSDRLKEKLKETYSFFSAVEFVDLDELDQLKLSDPKSENVFLDYTEIKSPVEGIHQTPIIIKLVGISRISKMKDGYEIIMPLSALLDTCRNINFIEASFAQSNIILSCNIKRALKEDVNLKIKSFIKSSGKKNMFILKLDKSSNIYFLEDENEISNISEINKLFIVKKQDDFAELIFSQESHLLSYVFKTFKGSFKLIIDSLTGVTYFCYKHEVKSYWNSFNEATFIELNKNI